MNVNITRNTRDNNEYLANTFKTTDQDFLDAMRYCYNDVADIKKFEAYCLGKWPARTYKSNRLIDLRLGISKVIFNDPATIILWSNGTKTVVKCSEDDTFDPEKGLAMAIAKRLMDRNKFKKLIENAAIQDV